MNVFIISGRGLSFFETVFNGNSEITINLIASKSELLKCSEDILSKFNNIFEVEETYNLATRVFEFKVDAILNILKDYTEIKIVCIREENLDISASIRDSLQINTGMNSRQMEKFRDKILMKKILSNLGIKIPKFVTYNYQQTNSYSKIKAILGYSFIAKPIFSLGSKGVFKIKNNNDFEKFAISYKEKFNNCPFELEEFIELPLFHVDVIMQNGISLFAKASEYTCPVADFFEGKIFGTIPIINNEVISKSLIDFSLRVIEAFGNLDAVYHVELFYNAENDECIFLEIAARPSGYTWPQVLKETFGVNLYDAHFMIQTGIQLKNINNDNKTDFASCFLIPNTMRRIKKITTPKLKSIFTINWHIIEGAESNENNLDFSGVVMMKNKNYKDLYYDFNYLKNEYAPFEYE